MSIAREGWPFVVTLLAVAGLLFALRYPGSGGALLVLGLFTAFFFRDPERAIPQDPGLVLSPADGKVVMVAEAPAEHPLGPGTTQVSIFLSIFNVHVNRSPIGGKVAAVQYHKGEFLPAFDDKASLRNEQNSVIVEGDRGRVMFKQIAGLIARRIVFRKSPGDPVAAGERVGLIKFGSRVDVFLPPRATLKVELGDHVAGGTSVLAEMR
jgi:phosphatidylserine decarboxylase